MTQIISNLKDSYTRTMNSMSAQSKTLFMWEVDNEFIYCSVVCC